MAAQIVQFQPEKDVCSKALVESNEGKGHCDSGLSEAVDSKHYGLRLLTFN
jgi:hypothetical protein